MLKHLTKCFCRDSIDHLKQLVSQFGTDCWWTLPMSELLPSSVISKVRNLFLALFMLFVATNAIATV